jgi:hypothetical protein
VSENVLADPQFGLVSILRPFAGFEAVYQGQNVDVPLMFTQGGEALDSLAGTTGYSPKLLRGLSVPFGSRIVIWLPLAFGYNDLVNFWYYKWTISWRLRNVYDFRQKRIPFHYPKQGPGVPDNASPRVVIPAAVNQIAYTQTPPAFNPDTTTALNVDIVSPHYNVINQPLLPDGSSGQYQQGILPSTSGAMPPYVPSYVPYEIQCEGDELLIGVTRNAVADEGAKENKPTWGFGDNEPDRYISDLFGSGVNVGPFVDIGVYVSAGSAP